VERRRDSGELRLKFQEAVTVLDEEDELQVKNAHIGSFPPAGCGFLM